MILYSKKLNKIYRTPKQVSADFKNIIFRKDVTTLPEEGLPGLELFPVNVEDLPEIDHSTHKIVENPVQEIEQEDGTYVYNLSYSAVEFTSEELESIQEGEAYRIDLFSREVRRTRTKLLSDTDWVVTKSLETGDDVPQAWREYRQALREITEQEGFPLEVNWPTEPE